MWRVLFIAHRCKHYVKLLSSTSRRRSAGLHYEKFVKVSVAILFAWFTRMLVMNVFVVACKTLYPHPYSPSHFFMFFRVMRISIWCIKYRMCDESQFESFNKVQSPLICVCMYVCMCIYIYTHTHTLSLSLCVCVCVFVRVLMHVFI